MECQNFEGFILIKPVANMDTPKISFSYPFPRFGLYSTILQQYQTSRPHSSCTYHKDDSHSPAIANRWTLHRYALLLPADTPGFPAWGRAAAYEVLEERLSDTRIQLIGFQKGLIPVALFLNGFMESGPLFFVPAVREIGRAHV